MNDTTCTLPLLVCELQFQFDMFDVHRKLLEAWKTSFMEGRDAANAPTRRCKKLRRLCFTSRSTLTRHIKRNHCRVSV